VKFIASRLAAQLPYSVEIDDLVSVGFIGLMDAADKFKESRGVKFSTYAEFRIRGAILDELRNLDTMPHCARTKAKEIDQTYGKLEQEIGRRPTDSEVSARLGLRRERFQKIKDRLATFSVIHCEDPEQLQTHATSSPGSLEHEGNPFNMIMRKNVTEFLGSLFKTLEEEERVVLSCYYFRGLNLREISQILAVTESRVSQIHTKAIFRLKQLMREHEQSSSESMFQLLLEAA
jgi:RNA polymerase sigma factor for flagellar operon FliA